MPDASQPHLDLIIEADSATRVAQFYLRDEHGIQIGYHQLDFNTIPPGEQHALFDLRSYLDTLAKPGEEAHEVAKLGVCIAEKVLGQEIWQRLAGAAANQTLRIQLPGAAQEDNRLAAQLACVPWEIARPAIGQPSLMDNNLLLRMEQSQAATPSTSSAADAALALHDGETLRVLFVLAEARGAQPLGMRQERLQIQRLFEKDIYPKRKVVAHFLTHGVTRARLRAQLRAQGGYHILHWSGHGNCGVLELAEANGASTTLTGAQLVDLFREAAAPLPRLVFLSACNSGEAGSVQSMDDLMALAAGKPARREGPRKDIPLAAQPGFTGTAHALRQRGVPAVVAMRYSVGDDYARELAREFYKNLLALDTPRAPAGALVLARSALRTGKLAAQFDPCDHATPMLYGGDAAPFAMAKGRSAALDRRKIRLNPVGEMAAPAIADFVGRTWELAELGTNFIGSGYAAEEDVADASANSAGCAVALVSGLGGMGKTALCAEALALWESNFTWVLIYQAKPNPLAFDATLRDIHQRLKDEQQEYYHHIKQYPADAIHREADADFTGKPRLQRLIENLVRAMQAEPILLVLDNFETNLKPNPVPSSAADADENSALWQCQDEWWDECLKQLAQGLAGTGSRVLITCRHPLAALAATAADAPTLCHTTPLGPLAPAEAALFLRTHPVLQKMTTAAATERQLAWRLLNTSRFHPLLMDRLAKLAAEPALRPQLLQALETLEQRKDFAQLPALFASKAGDASELAYLNHALAISIDQLLEHASAETRRLLWVIALANEAVTLGLLKAVWQSQESAKVKEMRKIKQLLAMLAQQPATLTADLQQQVQSLPAEFVSQLTALPPPPTPQPDPDPLLRHLLIVGLANTHSSRPNDENPILTCDELVRKRISAWMAHQPLDQGNLTDKQIRLAYADHLVAYFDVMQHQDMTRALQAGSRAITYCVQAEAYDKLELFAGDIVTSSGEPQLLQALLPDLRSAAESAPPGRSRWFCIGCLADALREGGQPAASLSFYQQAIELAQTATVVGGAMTCQAWSDLIWLYGNAAAAYNQTGNLNTARQHLLANADAQRQAASPAINIIGSELEALRICIKQGQAKQVLPEIEARLAQVTALWQTRAQATPNAEMLARVYLAALNIAMEADFASEDWISALQRIDASLATMHHLQRPATDIACDRVNRANVLRHLQRHTEAQAELQACLPLFRHNPAQMATTLSSMASLFASQGDLAQARQQECRALTLREDLSSPGDRANSHDKLANWLAQSGTASTLIESHQHQLAALVYSLDSGLHQNLQTTLHSYAIHFRAGNVSKIELPIPRLPDLLADPAFAALASWLRQRGTDLAELQSDIDEVLAQVKRQALGEA